MMSEHRIEPFELIEKVDSFETFLEFLEALTLDKVDEDKKEKINPSSPYGSGHNGWENNSIASFLDAMYAGTEGADYPKNPTWQIFAQILYMGKIYE